MEDYSMLFKEDNGPLIFPQKTYSYDFDFSPRHGSVIHISDAEYDALISRYGK